MYEVGDILLLNPVFFTVARSIPDERKAVMEMLQSRDASGPSVPAFPPASRFSRSRGPDDDPPEPPPEFGPDDDPPEPPPEKWPA